MDTPDLPYLLLFVFSPILYEFNRGCWINNRARNGIKYYQVDLDSEAFKSLHFEGNLLVYCSVFLCYFILLQFSFEMPCTLFLLLELDILL